MPSPNYKYDVGDIVVTRSSSEQSALESQNWRLSNSNTDFTDGSTETILIQTGEERMELYTDIESDGSFTYTLYENPTVSEAGTNLNLNAVNRASIESSTASAESNPTITDTGTQLIETISTGSADTGAGANQAKTPGSITGEVGWILAKNTDYLIEIENTSGSTGIVSINAEIFVVPYNL